MEILRKRTKGERQAFIDGFVAGFTHGAEGYHRASEALEKQRETVMTLLEISKEYERELGDDEWPLPKS